jgi:choline dehydrogenase-like flavoprotein
MKREAEVDYVIVGTGAGGATAARVLADTGLTLLLLEEGPSLRADERPRAVADAMPLTFRDNGTLATHSAAPFPVLQGCLVGGSTAINSGIIWRMPDDVRREWATHHGLAALVEGPGLDAAFERIERELAIAETPVEVRGRNAELMAEACRKLGLPGRPIVRNVRDCAGSARCLQGCPRAARQSMDVSYVPYALARGATLWEGARADRIEIESGRAVGVRGTLIDPRARTRLGGFRVRAKRGVIVAAGAVFTPMLLWKSGLRGAVGARFQAHPGAAVVGFFDFPIVQGFGATQAYEVPMRERGYKLETLSLPPELLAARIPGAGGPWRERIARLGNTAHWAAQVRMAAHGTVRPGWFGGPVIRYAPLPEDMAKLRESLALLVRMLFAAGAREVSHGIHGLPPVFHAVTQAELIEQYPLQSHHVHLLASHIFGTACAGADSLRSVVNSRLETHAVRRLFVMDASVFPTNMGVNPQHSIMGIVMHAASQLV